MSKWLMVGVLVLLALVSAVGLRSMTASAQMVAGGGAPMPITPWSSAKGGGAPMPITPWSNAKGGGAPMPITPWSNAKGGGAPMPITPWN